LTFLRRPEGWVFVILLASYAYFWQARDWNAASRLMLTYALVDRGTLSIDGLEDQTGDIAKYQGHYYSDKNPGYSFLAVAPYALAKAVFRLPDHPLNQPGFAHWPADYWITLGTSGLLTALSGVILVALARDLGCGPRQSALVGLAYGLATPAFAYATLGYGHQVAAFCLLASFSLLTKTSARPRLRAAVAGFLAGYASVVEIQLGPVSAILGLYLVGLVVGKKWPVSAAFAFGLGAAVPTLILLTYNYLAFGSPWKMGYFFEVHGRFKDVHSSSNPLGIVDPDWLKLGELLWAERRGLVRFAPIVVLTVPGLVALMTRRRWAMAIVSTLTMAAVLLVNLSYPEWTGGWSTGPRLLVPMLPFALIPVAGLLAVGGRWASVPALLLALAGSILILGFVTVGARVPDLVARPLVEGVWPLLRGDRPLPGWVFGNRYARNLASLAFPEGVKRLPTWAGWVSVVPLILFQIGMVGLMLRFVRNERPDVKPVIPGAE
jgi:MFS family permease